MKPGYIFVFGSNQAGLHGAGAAKHAARRHGAVRGQGYGPMGTCFGIPTKNHYIKTLPIGKVEEYITKFLIYAHAHPELEFQVTRVGCGLAEYDDEDIAPMFRGAPSNCHFDDKWKPYLGEDNVKYWGSY